MCKGSDTGVGRAGVGWDRVARELRNGYGNARRHKRRNDAARIDTKQRSSISFQSPFLIILLILPPIHRTGQGTRDATRCDLRHRHRHTSGGGEKLEKLNININVEVG